MHCQAGANHDRWDAGPSCGYHLAQRSPGPKTETMPEVYLQPYKYPAMKQLHMNRQTPRALRHAERANKQKGKLRIEEHVRSQSHSDRVALRDILYQEQQQGDLGYGSGDGEDMKRVLAYPSRYQPEAIELGSLNDLVPKPLSIRPKKPKSVPTPWPSPSKLGLSQSARASVAYGINELAGSSLKPSLSLGDSPLSSSNNISTNTRQTTLVSPIDFVESDAIFSPQLPSTPSTSDLKRRKSGRPHFENTFFTSLEESIIANSPSELGGILSGQPRTLAGEISSSQSEELDIANGPSELRIGLSGKSRTLASERTSRLAMTKQAVTPDKVIKLDGAERSMPTKSGFTGLLPSPKLLQKRNGHFHEVFEKAKNAVHIKTAVEKRREGLKQNITVIGVTDQTPGMDLDHLIENEY